jgi:anti-anti-sigma factor
MEACMKINTQHDGQWLVISLDGRLDMASASDLERQAQEELERGERNFILDLAKLVYVSSAGLRAMLVLGRQAQSRQGRLLICAASGEVDEVLKISGFSTILEAFPDLAAARASQG